MTELGKKRISENNGMHKLENREKVRKFRLGKHWFNNGKVTVCAVECPEGFAEGMLKRKQNG